MDKALAIPTLTCPLHPNELIIRATLQQNNKQLLFCHQCLESKPQVTLIKLHELLPTLQKQYQDCSANANNATLPPEAEELTINQKEIQMQFSEQSTNYKEKANEEIKKVQTEMTKLLQNVNTSIDGKLDQYRDSFNKTFEDYNKSIKAHQELLADLGHATPNQQEIKDKIFNTESSQEAENNLREVLKSIKMRRDIKDGTAIKNLNQVKDILKRESEGVFEISEKSIEKYSDALKTLQLYLEGSIYESNENQKEGEGQQKEVSQELTKAFGKLNQVLEESNTQIKAIFEDRFQIKMKEKKVCSLNENGMKDTLGKAYKCLTCWRNYNLREGDYACEACIANCHAGHQTQLVDNIPFTCRCQFVMRECKLATCCTVKFSGHNYIRQDNHRCTTDNMEYGNCVCAFCAKNCHKGHSVAYYATGTSFCDCADLFSFCKSPHK